MAGTSRSRRSASRLSRPLIKADVIEAFVDSLHIVFLAAVPVIAVAFVLSFFIKELPLRTHADATTPAAADDQRAVEPDDTPAAPVTR